MARTRRTRAQWQQLLEQWQQSDDTVAAFCLQQGISQGSFYKWRQQLSQQNTPVASVVKGSPWQEIELPVPPSSDNHWQVELSLPGGAVLRLRQD